MGRQSQSPQKQKEREERRKEEREKEQQQQQARKEREEEVEKKRREGKEAKKEAEDGKEGKEGKEEEEEEEEGEEELIGLGKDATYFGYYGQLVNQQNMLADSVRTGAYHYAITRNHVAFKDKVVLDVGAGSGILSFFALQAGARKVYAVEASHVAQCARVLAESNGYAQKMTVLQQRLEEVELEEKVDVIVSEPMGVLLLHERMVETYILARTKWLREGGSMYPNWGSIHVAPFSDGALYSDTISKARFWQQQSFCGLDLSALAGTALQHHFMQPVVGNFDPRCLLAPPARRHFDFMQVSLEELREFEIDLSFEAGYTAIMHGMAGWFDVGFEGPLARFTLSTSPFAPRTHWYQVRFLFPHPLALNAGQRLSGSLRLAVNAHRSYDVRISLHVDASLPPLHVDMLYHLHEQQYWYPTTPDPSTPAPFDSLGLYPPPGSLNF